jgi:hypothetical protein
VILLGLFLANFELKYLISTFTGDFMKKKDPNLPDFEKKKIQMARILY